MLINIKEGDTIEDIRSKLDELARVLYMDYIPSQYEIKIEKTSRTNRQNNALHKYFELLSDDLNNAGISRNKFFEVLKDGLMWSPESVKTTLWHTIQEAMGLGRSTSKLKRDDVGKIYDNITVLLADRLKMENPAFPSYLYNEKE